MGAHGMGEYINRSQKIYVGYVFSIRNCYQLPNEWITASISMSTLIENEILRKMSRASSDYCIYTLGNSRLQRDGREFQMRCGSEMNAQHRYCI